MLHQTSYTKNRQTLLIERKFGNTKPLSEILYEYVCEQNLTPGRPDDGKGWYTDDDITAVSEKEV